MKTETSTAEITFNNMPQAVAKMYQEISSIREELLNIKLHFSPKTPTEWLTRNEVAEMLKVDLSTLWNWQNKGKLKPYGIGNRVYYKRSEVEAALIPFGKHKELGNE